MELNKLRQRIENKLNSYNKSIFVYTNENDIIISSVGKCITAKEIEKMLYDSKTEVLYNYLKKNEYDFDKLNDNEIIVYKV